MRSAAGLAFALVAGLAIGYVDSRPTWDDDGVTAIALLAAAAVAAWIAPRRAWWLVVLLVAMPTPLFDGDATIAVATVLFAGIGALLVWLPRREVARGH